MWVNFMSPFPTSFFYLFASSTKISQYDSPIHALRKKKPYLFVNQNESHHLDMSYTLLIDNTRKYGIGFLMLSFNKVTNLYDISSEAVHCLRVWKRSRKRKLTDK